MTPNKLDELTVLTDARAATFDAYIIARIVKRLMDFLRAHPEQPLALIPASINDVHRLIQRGMIAEEVQLAVQEQLPGLQQEIANAFYDAADEIAKDYIADALMDTTEFVEKGVEEATGLKIEDIQREVHKERVEEGVEPPEILEELEEAIKEQEERKKEEAKPEQAPVIPERVPTPPQAPPTAPNRPQNPPPEQTPNEPPKEPTKPTDGGDDYNYPDFVTACGYGNILGICGINCRHTFSAFRPGINIDRGTNVDYEKNAERYKLTQKQRAMEREIRKIERRLAALRASGDDSEETKTKIDELVSQRKKLGEQYAKFTRENNLPSENWRFAISATTGAPAIGPGVLARTALSQTELERLDEMYRRTNGEVRNLCRTTAPSTEQAFIDACDNAYIKARGGISLNTVIMEAIDEVASQGVTTVNYNSGRTDRIEVAIARAVRTGLNQANASIVLGKCAEQGINYVKVSEHMGARVTKNEDYTNHAWWQGKVYKLDWGNPALAGYNVVDNTNNEALNNAPQNNPVLNDNISSKYEMGARSNSSIAIDHDKYYVVTEDNPRDVEMLQEKMKKYADTVDLSQLKNTKIAEPFLNKFGELLELKGGKVKKIIAKKLDDGTLAETGTDGTLTLNSLHFNSKVFYSEWELKMLSLGNTRDDLPIQFYAAHEWGHFISSADIHFNESTPVRKWYEELPHKHGIRKMLSDKHIFMGNSKKNCNEYAADKIAEAVIFHNENTLTNHAMEIYNYYVKEGH